MREKSQKKAWTPARIQRMLLGSATFLLLLLLLVYDDRFTPVRNSNELLIGQYSQDQVFEVLTPIQVPLSGLSLEDVLNLRRNAVAERANFLKGSYSPSEVVFGRIQSGKPWFSSLGFFVKGLSEQSREGPSYLSMGVLSPFQLVIPTFWGLSIWGDGHVKWKPNVLSNPEGIKDLPLQPRNFPLQWHPAAARASMVWRVQQYLDELAYFTEEPVTLEHADFGVSLFNARDLNLRYVALDAISSSGIETPKYTGEVIHIMEHFAFSRSACGMVEGCNHTRNMTPQLDTIKIQQLPAIISFKLWKRRPKSSEETADFTYVIELE